MNFAEYLLSKEFITNKNFVDAVVEQMTATPSLLSIIRDSKKISDEKMAQMLLTQVRTGKGILEIVKEGGYLSNSDIDELMQISEDKMPSFVEALIRVTNLTSGDLKEQYENYLNVVKNNIPRNIEPEISNAALESLREIGGDLSDFEEIGTKTSEGISSSEINISEAALESLKEIGGSLEEFEVGKDEEPNRDENGLDGNISPAALESLRELGMDLPESMMLESQTGVNSSNYAGFLEIYDERMIEKLKKISEIIRKTADANGDIANFLNSLFREIHMIYEASLNCDNELSTILGTLEKDIEQLLTKDQQFLKTWVSIKLDALNILFDNLLAIKEEIKSGAKITFSACEESLKKVTDPLN